jgi:hypothetical protein
MYHKNFIWLIVLLFLLVISSCKLSEEEDLNNSEEIDFLTDNYHGSFFQFEISGNGFEEQFFISGGGLMGIYANYEYGIPEYNHPAYSRYRMCIRNLHLTTLETLFFPGFELCIYDDSLIYIQETVELSDYIDGIRLKIIEDFNNGLIEENVALEKFDELKNVYRDSVLEIKNKYNVKFKTCLREGFIEIREYLGKQKWPGFRDCIKGLYI